MPNFLRWLVTVWLSCDKQYLAIFSKLVNQLSPFAFKGFHTWVDKRMEVHNSGCSMVIVINMFMLWENPLNSFCGCS